MSTFNPGKDIHVEKDDKQVRVRFGEDTLGVNYTPSGFSLTNDWNNRHFTLGFGEDSVLYHITREDLDDRSSGKQKLRLGEFVAEIYGYMRSVAPPVPTDELSLDFVGRINVDRMRSYLKSRNVIRETTDGLCVDHGKKVDLENQLKDDPVALSIVYQEVLEPVSFEKAISADSDEHVYLYPTGDGVYVLFNFPDDYVGLATMQNLLNFAEYAGGSQIVDHIIRSISD